LASGHISKNDFEQDIKSSPFTIERK